MVNPPSRRSQAISKRFSRALRLLVLGILCSLSLFEASHAYGRDQQQMSRLTNNKTFYSTEVPLLKPPQTLMAMRYFPIYEPASLIFDSVRANKLSEIAKKAPYKKTNRQCMKWVRIAISKLMGNPSLDLNSLPSDPGSNLKKQVHAGRSSEGFIKWALNNPISLCKNLKLANVTEHPELASQEGVIHLYAKSSCGFSRRYGHAEVLTNSKLGIACSDHCRTISRPCNPDLVLAPVLHCESLANNDNKVKEFISPAHKQKPMLMTRYIEPRPPAQ